MIPIHDTTHPSKTFPIVNTGLIVINVFFFLIQLTRPDQGVFIYVYGLVPARYTQPDIAVYFPLFNQILSFFSFMFLHGGFMHIIGNMWFLHIFGDNVEAHLGPFRYLAFYLLCGIISGAAHIMLNLDSTLPTIGASGAIAGVMGGYFLLFPKARVLTLIPIIIIPYFIELPAYFFLAVWFLIQFFNAAGSHDVSGVAWWAHVGGFVAGMIGVKAMDLLPHSGMQKKLAPLTAKKHTRHLQAIHATGNPGDPNLYGTLSITPYESQMGSQKLVNIPWGFHNRLFKVKIPPGTGEGTLLRLSGMGRTVPGRDRGDLLLKVMVA